MIQWHNCLGEVALSLLEHFQSFIQTLTLESNWLVWNGPLKPQDTLSSHGKWMVTGLLSTSNITGLIGLLLQVHINLAPQKQQKRNQPNDGLKEPLGDRSVPLVRKARQKMERCVYVTYYMMEIHHGKSLCWWWRRLFLLVFKVCLLLFHAFLSRTNGCTGPCVFTLGWKRYGAECVSVSGNYKLANSWSHKDCR